ncbi:MAG: hypothetical protein FJW22_05040 [Acidimicrobiia bacterium]|nr:hypothetical protein [Acidimicrobiia bacterium]
MRFVALSLSKVAGPERMLTTRLCIICLALLTPLPLASCGSAPSAPAAQPYAGEEVPLSKVPSDLAAGTSQYAGFRTSTGLNGSTVGGGTHHPYDVSKSAGGSSNGSAISAATSFAAGTIGTETSGSITGPANLNGVVGLTSPSPSSRVAASCQSA